MSSTDHPASPYPADTSLAEVMEELAGRGYDVQVDVDDDTGDCTCASCGGVSGPGQMVFDDARRIEGASDPAEMTNVLAVRCPQCGARGVIASRYGPEASAGEVLLLAAARGTTRG